MPLPDTEIVDLCVPGTTRYIVVVRRAVETVAEQLGFGTDERMGILLAVGEACNNAVLHAAEPLGETVRPWQTASSVSCHITITSETLSVEVRNTGAEFLPNSASAPMPDALTEQGRGMALMHLLMDDVQYRLENGDTVVRLVKKRPFLSQ